MTFLMHAAPYERQQQRPCSAQQLCRIWLELLEQLVLYCHTCKLYSLIETTNLPDLVVQVFFPKRQHYAIPVSGRDCSDRNSCAITVMFINCTPLAVFPLWSDQVGYRMSGFHYAGYCLTLLRSLCRLPVERIVHEGLP